MPFGEYESMEDCISKNQDKDDPGAYCATIHHEITGKWPSEGKWKEAVKRAKLKEQELEFWVFVFKDMETAEAAHSALVTAGVERALVWGNRVEVPYADKEFASRVLTDQGYIFEGKKRKSRPPLVMEGVVSVKEGKISGRLIHPVQTFHPNEFPELRQYIGKFLEDGLKNTELPIPLCIDHQMTSLPTEKNRIEKLTWNPRALAIDYEGVVDEEIEKDIQNGLIKHVSAEIDFIPGTLEKPLGAIYFVNGSSSTPKAVPAGFKFPRVSLLKDMQPGDPTTNVKLWQEAVESQSLDKVIKMKTETKIQKWIETAKVGGVVPDFIKEQQRTKPLGTGPPPDEDRAKTHFNLTDEQWEALTEEEKKSKIAELPAVGSKRIGEVARKKIIEASITKFKEQITPEMSDEEKIQAMMDFFGLSRHEAIVELIDSGDLDISWLEKEGIKEQNGEMIPKEDETKEDFMVRCRATERTDEECEVIWGEHQKPTAPLEVPALEEAVKILEKLTEGRTSSPQVLCEELGGTWNEADQICDFPGCEELKTILADAKAKIAKLKEQAPSTKEECESQGGTWNKEDGTCKMPPVGTKVEEAVSTSLILRELSVKDMDAEELAAVLGQNIAEVEEVLRSLAQSGEIYQLADGRWRYSLRYEEAVKLRKQLFDANEKVKESESKQKAAEDKLTGFREAVENVLPPAWVSKAWGLSGAARLLRDIREVINKFETH